MNVSRLSFRFSFGIAAAFAGAAFLAFSQGSAAAQRTKLVPRTSIMQPSNNPPSSVQMHKPVVTGMYPTLTRANTGPVLVFTCDANVAPATCTYLNSTVAGYYNATFTNANANIYIQYGDTGLGSSEYYFNYVSYNQYATAYANLANKSSIQTSAAAALTTYDATPYGSDYVWIQPAVAGALGISNEVQGGAVNSGLGPLGIQTSTSYCVLGTANCYNGIITVTNNSGITLYYDNLGGSQPAGSYDFYAVVEHEVDEVLGTGSCITTQTNPISDSCDGGDGNSGSPSTVDLFRYSSAGNLVLNSSLSTATGAYFSYDGGTTNGAKGIGNAVKFYNTLDNGADYGDWAEASPCNTNEAIQDAFGCPGADGGLTILNDGGGEVNILTTIGYGVPGTTTACSTGNPNPNPNPAALVAPGDFNADCKTDILWRNTNTGQVNIWLMNGTSLPSSGSVGTVANSWVIQGAGDFNGDGKSDILWRNSSSGQVVIWLMNGASMSSSANLGPVASAWVVQGIGDFNGDGKSDILWRNSSTGQVVVWLMNGTSISTTGSAGTVANSWVIQVTGDFNGDGKSDILWRNTSTGQVSVWLMNGTALSNSGSPGTVASVWAIQGAGDFDGDGKSDILWRNTSTGQVSIWLMDGTALSNSGSPGTAASVWAIQGAGDFNGDGKSDIVWRNTSTGQVSVWLMNGTTLSSSGNTGTAPTSWQINNP